MQLSCVLLGSTYLNVMKSVGFQREVVQDQILSCWREKGGDALNSTAFPCRGRGCTFQDTHPRALVKTFLHMSPNTCMSTI